MAVAEASWNRSAYDTPSCWSAISFNSSSAVVSPAVRRNKAQGRKCVKNIIRQVLSVEPQSVDAAPQLNNSCSKVCMTAEEGP